MVQSLKALSSDYSCIEDIKDVDDDPKSQKNLLNHKPTSNSSGGWLDKKDKICLNADKPREMITWFNRVQPAIKPAVIGGMVIKRVSEYSLLGITISSAMDMWMNS